MNAAVTKRTEVRLLAALLAVGAAGACAGENLFTNPGVGASTPQVEITAPVASATVVQGASLSVAANATAQAGGANVEYKGINADGTAAFVTQTGSLNGLVSLELGATLAAAPTQVTGSAKIIVRVTDQSGGVGADTVSVTITATNE